MSSTVQNHIDRGEYLQVFIPIQHLSRCTQLFRIGVNVSRLWQYRMMHVDHGRSSRVGDADPDQQLAQRLVKALESAKHSQVR